MKRQKELIQIIVEICGQVLFKDKRQASDYQVPALTAKEWDTLFSLASLHGALPTVMQLVEGLKIEEKDVKKVVLKWYAAAQGNKKRYQVRVNTIRELAMMFAEDNLDMMVFKGAALAQLYPNPDWRVFSDIDFFLYGKYMEGIKVMDRHGIKNSPFYHHNTEATLNGVLLENHYDFVERLNHKHNLVLDEELKKMAAEEGHNFKASFLGGDIDNVYVMTPTMNALFLLRHMSAHFVSESIPLRMLYDWILFLRAHASEVDWNRVTALYDAAGMTKFVGIVQGILKSHFGVVVNECPVKPLDGELVAKVWESVVYPPQSNPHKMYTWGFFVYETKTFLGNRWKHQIVYPGESYFLLSFRYAWSVIKKKLGLLTIPEGR